MTVHDLHVLLSAIDDEVILYYLIDLLVSRSCFSEDIEVFDVIYHLKLYALAKSICIH